MKIIPSLLVQTEEEFTQQIADLDHAVDMIQIDVADGNFVPQKTWADPHIIQQVIPSDMHIELHMMVQDPLEELKRWQAVKQVIRVLIHVESISDLSTILPTLQTKNWEIGLVLNPETPISIIEPYLQEINVIMFMGVHPGKQGQTLIPEVLEKISLFTKQTNDHIISIDGGVNEHTLPKIVQAGAHVICPGSAIFHNERTPRENVERMYQIIKKLQSNN